MYVCLTDRGCCGVMPVWYFMYLRTVFPKLIWCSVYFPGITDINFRVQRWAHKSPVCNKECDESGGIIWPSDVTVCLAAIAGVEMFPVTGCVKCWEDLIIVTLLIMERLFPLKVRETAFKKNRTLYISDIIFMLQFNLLLFLPLSDIVILIQQSMCFVQYTSYSP